MQLPGDTECRPVGTACPDPGDRFPSEEELLALAPEHPGPVVYVDALAAGGGDGSRQRPYPGFPPGGRLFVGAVVAFAPGDYELSVSLPGDLAVVGACAAGVRLRGPATDQGILALSGEAAMVVSNLTLVGPSPALAVFRDRGPLIVRSVVIEGSRASGIDVLAGGQADISDVVVRGTTLLGDPHPPGDGGLAIAVRSGARATIRRVVAQDSEGAGFWFDSRSRAGGEVVVEDSVAERGVRLGRGPESGMVVTGDVRLTVERVLLERHPLSGLAIAFEPGVAPPRVSATDLAIRGNASQADPGQRKGQALEISGLGELEIRRLFVEAAQYIGVLIWGNAGGPPTVSASQVAVVSTAPVRQGGFGWSVGVAAEADVTLEQAALLGHAELGFAAVGDTFDKTPVAALSDVVIADTLGQGGDRQGRAIELSYGAVLHGERIEVLDSTGIGVLLSGWGRAPETRLTATDLAVRRTQPALCGEIPEGQAGSCVDEGASLAGGNALIVAGGARARLDRFELAGADVAGLVLARGGVITPRQGRISDNGIGIVVVPDEDAPADDIDLAAWEGVQVYDNGTDVAHEQLHVPTPAQFSGDR